MALIVWHVETSGGARFDWALDEEHFRQQLIDYNNNVLNDDEPDDQLAADATVEEAIEKIEERENLSREDMDNAYLIEPRERETILAALRLWQHAQEDSITFVNGAEDMMDEFVGIANNGGTVEPLTADEIDTLCERINT